MYSYPSSSSSNDNDQHQQHQHRDRHDHHDRPRGGRGRGGGGEGEGGKSYYRDNYNYNYGNHRNNNYGNHNNYSSNNQDHRPQYYRRYNPNNNNGNNVNVNHNVNGRPRRVPPPPPPPPSSGTAAGGGNRPPSAPVRRQQQPMQQSQSRMQQHQWMPAAAATTQQTGQQPQQLPPPLYPTMQSQQQQQQRRRHRRPSSSTTAQQSQPTPNTHQHPYQYYYDYYNYNNYNNNNNNNNNPQQQSQTHQAPPFPSYPPRDDSSPAPSSSSPVPSFFFFGGGDGNDRQQQTAATTAATTYYYDCIGYCPGYYPGYCPGNDEEEDATPTVTADDNDKSVDSGSNAATNERQQLQYRYQQQQLQLQMQQHRHATLLSELRRQVEYYFSDYNLSRDEYLQSLLRSESHPNMVPVAVVASFPMIKVLYYRAAFGLEIEHDNDKDGEHGGGRRSIASSYGPVDSPLVAQAVAGSPFVEVSPDGHWFSRVSRYETNADADTNGANADESGNQKHAEGRDASTAATSPTVSPTSFADESAAAANPFPPPPVAPQGTNIAVVDAAAAAGGGTASLTKTDAVDDGPDCPDSSMIVVEVGPASSSPSTTASSDKAKVDEQDVLDAFTSESFRPAYAFSKQLYASDSEDVTSTCWFVVFEDRDKARLALEGAPKSLRGHTIRSYLSPNDSAAFATNDPEDGYSATSGTDGTMPPYQEFHPSSYYGSGGIGGRPNVVASPVPPPRQELVHSGYVPTQQHDPRSPPAAAHPQLAFYGMSPPPPGPTPALTSPSSQHSNQQQHRQQGPHSYQQGYVADTTPYAAHPHPYRGYPVGVGEFSPGAGPHPPQQVIVRSYKNEPHAASYHDSMSSSLHSRDSKDGGGQHYTAQRPTSAAKKYDDKQLRSQHGASFSKPVDDRQDSASLVKLEQPEAPEKEAPSAAKPKGDEKRAENDGTQLQTKGQEQKRNQSKKGKKEVAESSLNKNARTFVYVTTVTSDSSTAGSTDGKVGGIAKKKGPAPTETLVSPSIKKQGKKKNSKWKKNKNDNKAAGGVDKSKA